MARFILSTLFISIAASTAAIGGDQTMWIGPVRSEGPPRQLALEKDFSLGDLPAKAELRVAADFANVELSINGHSLLSSTPFNLPIPMSARRRLRSGDNKLVIQMLEHGGPAAVAVELELVFQDGRTQTVCSDASWEVKELTGPAWLPVQTFGSVDAEPWWKIRTRPTTNAFDEYNQWQEARAAKYAGSTKFQLPKDFAMDVLYRVPREYGSWISMTIDDRGRLIVGKESSGLLRLSLDENSTPPRVEIINEDLKGCHGLLWSNGRLFANASDSRALYRLRDSNGDDAFDEVRRLREIPGGGGDHGRNDLVEGADGAIYSIHGDAVDLPDGYTSRVPVTREFAASRRPKGGHVIRTDANGSIWEVLTAGLRNPYGLAFNQDGELFTYDADSERHVGLPWYRPTRMNHLVAGADYGWRSRDGLPWPIYHADSLPPNVLIGRGSPTSVKFAYASNFPPAYQRAMFAPDWSFGRVFAVHVVPQGASYSMHPELFLRGRPLNIVDLEFAPDGSMYLLTGGYKTRSVLYKLRYTGAPSNPPGPTQQESERIAYSERMRSLRRKLESFQRHDVSAVDLCWKYLDHPDRWIRHAARIVLEHQPAESWQARVWSERRPELSLPALLALARASSNLDSEKAWIHLAETRIDELPPHLRLTAVRTAQWLDKYHSADASAEVIRQFEAVYPTGNRALDRELCSLLGAHGSRSVVHKTLGLLASDLRQTDALHFLMVLSKTPHGWTNKDRKAYFRLVQGARLYRGDEGLPEIIGQLERDALELVPEASRATFAALLASDGSGEETTPARSRPFVRKWNMSDFETEQSDTLTGDPKLGERVFREAQCGTCHRVGTVGRSYGPDLTGVAGRFSRAEILDAILDPSKVVASRFVNHIIFTNDGKTHTGQVIWDGFRKSMIRIAPDPMRMDKVVEISKHDIESQEPSAVSPMPQGLLDTFQRNEIDSLLMFLEAGGSG